MTWRFQTNVFQSNNVNLSALLFQQRFYMAQWWNLLCRPCSFNPYFNLIIKLIVSKKNFLTSRKKKKLSRLIKEKINQLYLQDNVKLFQTYLVMNSLDSDEQTIFLFYHTIVKSFPHNFRLNSNKDSGMNLTAKWDNFHIPRQFCHIRHVFTQYL